MNFRDLVIDDYDELLSLWEKAGGIYRPNGRDSREKIAEELEKDTAIFLVAETDGSIVGTVFGTHDGRKGWINRLAISPDYRYTQQIPHESYLITVLIPPCPQA